MTFTNDKAIFLQMADRLCDEILAGTYKADDRIPSVREYAVMLGVNTNTAVKTYELLAREGVIYNRRGMGYYVSPDARQQILERRRAEFREQTLPELFRQMRLLDIDIAEIDRAWAEK
ncbi:MAG: GntR family transcriptional regulator [Bacteroidales bacterium]|jgi:DNA-binding transcriptional regulator YhcF (GntR family)|nr:GntR family transcriptional regulator [Prevotella sp.]MBR3414370.1 GntR family transcriptional regulator [Bacteroidales bacterium]